MLYDQNVFRILEIEPTDDKKAIKKAYAKLVKRYHPEEFPEKWQEIHDAYEIALKIAEYKAVYENTEDSQNDDTICDYKEKGKEQDQEYNQEQSVEETDELDAIFDQIEQLSAEQKRNDTAFRKVIEQLQEIAGKQHYKKEEWEKFFNQDDILQFISRREFLYQLGDCLGNRRIDDDIYELLKKQIQLVKEVYVDRKIEPASIGFYPIYYAENKIDDAHKNRMQRNENSMKVFWSAALLIIAILINQLANSYVSSMNNQRDGYITETEQQQAEEKEEAAEEAKQSVSGKATETKNTAQGDTMGNVITEGTYRYLQEVILTGNSGTVCNVYIPKDEDAKMEAQHAYGWIPGFDVSVRIQSSSEEKDTWMKEYVEEQCEKDGTYVEYGGIWITQRMEAGERRTMANYEDAEYMTIYDEEYFGMTTRTLTICGYAVLEECEREVEEAVIIIKLSLSMDPDEAEEKDEILKELEAAYGLDLHEYYSSNLPQCSLPHTAFTRKESQKQS